METPFIRPEIAAWLRRWREPLAAGAAALLGVWWLLTAGGLLAWAGAALAILAGAACLVSFQRARFRPQGGGVGVVQLDEGRLTYFGPLSGGSVAVLDIEEVGLDPRHRPMHWRLRDAETELLIPVDAEGTDTLFDVFAQLPGLDAQRALSLVEHDLDLPTTLWRRRAPLPPDRRLH